jgi:hypothetical protein
MSPMRREVNKDNLVSTQTESPFSPPVLGQYWTRMSGPISSEKAELELEVDATDGRISNRRKVAK